MPRIGSKAEPRHLRIALGLLLSAAGALLASQPAPPDRDIEALKAVYQQKCGRCHGADGSGHGPGGQNLGGLDFTKAAKAFRQAEPADAERELRRMARAIQRGVFFGKVMPAWKDLLSPKETELMVREILMKAEAGKAIEPAPQPAQQPEAPRP